MPLVAVPAKEPVEILKAEAVRDATADAAMMELELSNRRRLISTLPTGDGALDFLSHFSSVIVSSGGKAIQSERRGLATTIAQRLTIGRALRSLI